MKKTIFALGALALFAGCATPPPAGPSVMVLPGSAKSFDQFRYDDNECRQFVLCARLSDVVSPQACLALEAQMPASCQRRAIV